MIGPQKKNTKSKYMNTLVSWYIFPNSFATKHLSLNFLLYHIVFASDCDNEGLLKDLLYYLNHCPWSLCNSLLCDFLGMLRLAVKKPRPNSIQQE